ncbi:TPA: dTDP-4-dehydrorhamnose 3,5-epimerase [Enterobacter ludwigii]
MKVIETSIPDVKIFEPTVFGDERGFFYESFRQKMFNEAVGRHVDFVQDNHSKSSGGVLRGLHYQMPPYAQAKLVRCIVGEVFDVAVDVRETSASFGQWVGVHLSATNKRQLWIPEGFAHGFLTLSENAEFVYKTTNYYDKESEAGVIWNDPELNIHWPLGELNVSLSQKDVELPIFASARYF